MTVDELAMKTLGEVLAQQSELAKTCPGYAMAGYSAAPIADAICAAVADERERIAAKADELAERQEPGFYPETGATIRSI